MTEDAPPTPPPPSPPSGVQVPMPRLVAWFHATGVACIGEMCIERVVFTPPLAGHIYQVLAPATSIRFAFVQTTVPRIHVSTYPYPGWQAGRRMLTGRDYLYMYPSRRAPRAVIGTCKWT